MTSAARSNGSKLIKLTWDGGAAQVAVAGDADPKNCEQVLPPCPTVRWPRGRDRKGHDQSFLLEAAMLQNRHESENICSI